MPVIYARQYLSAQSQLKRLSQSLASGDNIAQQREEVLQEIARFGCDQQNAPGRFASDGQPRHRNFLEDLFGGFQNQGDDDYGDSGQYNGQEQVEDPYADQQPQDTIRTVCVRLSDGYYWPISYSTTRDYVGQDTAACQAECPGQQVDLYFYDNPGQEPEQMVNATGQAYTALPVAFAYRKQFDLTNTCKPQQVVGQISVDDLGNGQTRAMVTYGGASFPLPLRDPRRVEQATALPAKYVAALDVPLPRPRPSSTTPAPVTPPTAEPVVSTRSRTVKVGDKIVRLVGPDTPYAPRHCRRARRASHLEFSRAGAAPRFGRSAAATI